MKKLLGALCVIAIVMNIYLGIYLDDSNDKTGGSGGDTSSDIIIPENFTVTVPDKRLGDIAQYDYMIFAEMYFENKSSREWQKYTLIANGQLINEILPDTIESKDGFNIKHKTMGFQEVTTASFDIIIDGSDSEKFTAHGNLDVTRNEYTDLNEKQIIQSVTSAFVEVDPLPRIPEGPELDGYIKNFPNPNEEQAETLDDEIYLGDKTLKLNDKGSILKAIDSDEEWVAEWLTQRYNWTVEGSERLRGYNTLILNITTGFYQGFVHFVKKIWIANEPSFPVKVYVRTNTSHEDENFATYIVLEHTRTLQEKTNNFIRGTIDIPWGTCNAQGTSGHFHQRHPRGEFKEWKDDGYLPKAGAKIDDSSFDFDPEVAEKYALEHSEGLDLFLRRYDDVVVDWGYYTAEKDVLDPQGKAGSYHWNLSFGYKPTYEEQREARESDEDPNWGYYVNLTKNVTKEPGIDKYNEEIKIINDGELRHGQSPLSSSEIDDDLLTLASSEAILKLDPDVQTEIYDGLASNEINFDDDTFFSLVMGDITSSTLPGMEIIETITGITLPSSRFSWVVQEGGILFLGDGSGELFNAAVDVETGQLVYVLKLDSKGLYGMFN